MEDYKIGLVVFFFFLWPFTLTVQQTERKKHPQGAHSLREMLQS